MEEKNWKILAIYMFNLSIFAIQLYNNNVGTKYDEKCTSTLREILFERETGKGNFVIPSINDFLILRIKRSNNLSSYCINSNVHPEIK